MNDLIDRRFSVCPICNSAADPGRKVAVYWVCPNCQAWFQHPMPPKVWHGPHETWVGKPMPEDEKRANEAVAQWLFKDVMGGKPGWTLDIGSCYPWLSQCLANLGCSPVEAADGAPPQEFGITYEEIDRKKVDCVAWDFEKQDYRSDDNYAPGVYDMGRKLITLVHSLEHMSDPVAVFKKLRRYCAADGAVFIRMPDHDIPGYERDMHEGMYQIHPFFHNLSSILELCSQTKTFTVTWTSELKPGQRDIVMRPT